MVRIGVVALFLGLLLAPGASGSPYVRYGIQDDAWLRYGGGTLDDRLDTLDALGVDLVRVTLSWRAIEQHRGERSWAWPDALLPELRARGIAPLVTLYGTPGWANGGRSVNVAPTRGADFAAFAAAAARRYPFVRLWAIWNEPNQRRWLSPPSPALYTVRLLNPAYAAIKRVSPRSQVAGGVTAPRGSVGGVSPVDFIRGLDRAGARLDAYAHNPYALRRGETPLAGGCDHCETITMSTLPRLSREVAKAFPPRTRIWLTEFGYQTSPPDLRLGVRWWQQARYTGEAAQRAYATPRVDVLVHYLYRDEPELGRWQSGVTTSTGRAKPALRMLESPLAQVSRHGLRTAVWGQLRHGEGRRRYVLQQHRGGAWHAVGHVRLTSARGYLTRVVRAGHGSRLRLWDVSTRTPSAEIAVQ